MLGYCMVCKSQKEMTSVQTFRTNNLKYVHEGRCVTCTSVITKYVKPNEHEPVFSDTGNVVTSAPSKIFIGEKTGKKLQSIDSKRQEEKAQSIIDEQIRLEEEAKAQEEEKGK